MNVRRINATRNTGIVTKAVIILMLIGLYLIMAFQPSCNQRTIKWKVWQSTINIPISNYTCGEIYERNLNGTLYKDNKQRKYSTDEIILYYLNNCRETNASSDMLKMQD